MRITIFEHYQEHQENKVHQRWASPLNRSVIKPSSRTKILWFPFYFSRQNDTYDVVCISREMIVHVVNVGFHKIASSPSSSGRPCVLHVGDVDLPGEISQLSSVILEDEARPC